MSYEDGAARDAATARLERELGEPGYDTGRVPSLERFMMSRPIDELRAFLRKERKDDDAKYGKIVAFTVQDNTLTMYQDGGMYTVASLYDMVDPTNAISRPAFGACVGEMTIGNSSPTLSSDTTGFISRTQFFNYSLAASQVSQIYFAGPTSSNLLRSLGVPEYGVRSPVYRLDG